MKNLLLRFLRIDDTLVKKQDETNYILYKILAELHRSRKAIETNNKAHGITEENGY